MSTDLTADVAIVGSGIAGALIAVGLAKRGAKTLVIEAGPRITHEEALQAFYQVQRDGRPGSPYPSVSYAERPDAFGSNDHLVQAGPTPYIASYERVVGGTTWHWEGVCLRLLPSDFRMRSQFGRAANWPITYNDLAPWYDEAERALGVAGDAQDDVGSPRSGDYPMPVLPLSYLDLQFAKVLKSLGLPLNATPSARNSVPYDGRPACCGSGSCIPICPTRARYDPMIHVEAAERAGAQIVVDSVVHRVELGTDRRVSGLRFKRPDGSEGMVSAKVYVLAANGIETAKILLMSRSERFPDGVANRSGHVGRNLMDHPYVVSWALSNEPLWPFRGPVTLSGVDSTRWGDWRAEQPGYRIVIANVGWAWGLGAPVSTVEELIDQDLESVALQRALRDHVSRQVMLASMTEQLPDPENRIVPDFDQRDAIGIPRPKLYYRYDDYTREGVKASIEIHERILQRLGVSNLNHEPDPFPGAHIMGTYRTGGDPESSVVDADLRAHDHPNLFLLGGGVFPSGGSANPTLTIAALSLRAVGAVLRALRA